MVEIGPVDWLIIGSSLLLSLAIGIYAGRRASKNSSEFFLSGRTMPWWLLGMSMVATTFSTDTPNLVADITRTNGVAGNWVWWSFLLTGMLTTFVFARLWRRSGVTTDVEFYELRYSGNMAAYLRGFRSIYLGALNILILAMVTLAVIKFGAVLMGWSPLKTILIAGTTTLIFSMVGGFLGVLLTDFVLFILAMAGAIGAAIFIVNLESVGGLSAMLSHPNVASKASMLPDMGDPAQYVPLLLVPLAVQWWSVVYPGAEPGGGGYVAQRMLAAKNEKNALGAVFLFNLVHYAIRPWPWILVALASLIVFPDLESLRAAFPGVAPDKIGEDMAYPAMLTFLPAGLMGLVIASLIAAYMSTIGTGLNLGASYFVNDLYRRFWVKDAGERHYVFVARIATLVIMVASSAVALLLTNAKQVFDLLLAIGAGTGLLFILRWFWWRINALSEIVAMALALGATIVLQLDVFDHLEGWHKLLLTVGITTVGWILAAFLGPKTDRSTLISFWRLTGPGGPGWEGVRKEAGDLGESPQAGLGLQMMCFFLGTVAIYSALFCVGAYLYGNYMLFGTLIVALCVSAIFLSRLWSRVSED